MSLLLDGTTPSDFDLPAKFKSWRAPQAEAADFVLLGDKPISTLCQPTGSGKTLVPAILQKLNPDQKLVVLTATRALQDQYIDELGQSGTGMGSGPGMVDMRGMSNYRCKMEGQEKRRWFSCEQGLDDGCPFALTNFCEFHAQKQKFTSADLGVTNYQFWMHAHRNASKPFGTIGTLVLDEADEAFDELARFLSVHISWSEAAELNKDIPSDRKGGLKLGKWKLWAKKAKKEAARLARSIDEKDNSEKRRLKDLAQKVWWVENITEGEWVWEPGDKGVLFECIWPGRYTRGTLFCGVERVVLISATVRPYTMKLLGIGRKDYQFKEWPRVFPVSRMPFIHVPTVAMTYRTSAEELELMVARVDEIIGDRLDRKGLIHTKSYERALYLQQHSRFARYFLLNDSRTTRDTAERFRKSKAPCILVSPSYPRGWDFAYRACEFQIIIKVPFDVTTTQIARQRKSDKNFMLYQVIQELVQMRGRGMRAEDDRCETIIIDNQAEWVVPLGIRKKMAPEWFTMRTLLETPLPPPKL